SRGWSIDRLAEATGVHRKTIIEVEAGRVAARISTLHGIAHALGVPCQSWSLPCAPGTPRQSAAPPRWCRSRAAEVMEGGITSAGVRPGAADQPSHRGPSPVAPLLPQPDAVQLQPGPPRAHGA